MSDCAICGARSSRLHHLTGTDAQNRHLDPELVIELCHSDHELIHDDWRTLGLQEAGQGLSRLERLELGWRRLAAAVGRLSEAHPGWGWLARLARFLGHCAEELAAELRARDARDPGWREDSAFYLEPDSHEWIR